MSSVSVNDPSSSTCASSKKRSSTSSTPPPKRNRMESGDEDDEIASESDYSNNGKAVSDYDTAQSLVQFSSSSSSNGTASSTPSIDLTVNRPSLPNSTSPPATLSQTERRRYLHRLYDRQRRARAAAAEESLKKMLFGGEASTIKKVDVLEKAVWALKSMQTKLKELNCNDNIINIPTPATPAWPTTVSSQSSGSVTSQSSPSLPASIPIHPPSHPTPLPPPPKEQNPRSPQPTPYRPSDINNQSGMQAGYYLHPSDPPINRPIDPISMMVYPPHFVQPRYSYPYHPPMPMNTYKYRSASVVQ